MTERCSLCGISADTVDAVICMDWNCPDNGDLAPPPAQDSAVAGPLAIAFVTTFGPIGVLVCLLISWFARP